MVDQVSPEPNQGRDDWAMLLDPAWQPRFDGEQPPPAAMVGGWLLDKEGNPGRFQPNPDYVPATDATPTDPADAVMRLLVQGEVPVDELIPTVRDALMELAVTEEGQPMVGPAPDGAPCVAVVTAAVHRERVGVEHWWQVTAEQLLEVLPPDTDILLNPGAPASTRLLAGALRGSFAEDSSGA